MALHCVSCRNESFHLLGSSFGILNIFAQNLYMHHRNDSTSACITHFIYILVLEDIIGSDVGGTVFGPYCTVNE